MLPLAITVKQFQCYHTEIKELSKEIYEPKLISVFDNYQNQFFIEQKSEYMTEKKTL